MARFEAFREISSRYPPLIDPTVQVAYRSQADLAGLVECLDYSRLSTTSRRKSQGGTSESHPLVSNLPSPFFDDFLNLLPLKFYFPGVYDDDEFVVLPSDPSILPAKVPSPRPPPKTTDKAAAIPTNANSSNMQFLSNMNGTNTSTGTAGPSHQSPRSTTRTTYSRGSGSSPSSDPHHYQEQNFPHCLQQEREPRPTVSMPACSSNFSPLDTIAHAPSYLSHLPSPPLLSSTANSPSSTAVGRNTPALLSLNMSSKALTIVSFVACPPPSRKFARFPP